MNLLARAASTGNGRGRLLLGTTGGSMGDVLVHCTAASLGAKWEVQSGHSLWGWGGTCRDDVVPIMTLRTRILEAIKNPADLRRVNEKDLQQVADELRAETINAVAVTGG